MFLWLVTWKPSFWSVFSGTGSKQCIFLLMFLLNWDHTRVSNDDKNGLHRLFEILKPMCTFTFTQHFFCFGAAIIFQIPNCGCALCAHFITSISPHSQWWRQRGRSLLVIFQPLVPPNHLKSDIDRFQSAEQNCDNCFLNTTILFTQRKRHSDSQTKWFLVAQMISNQNGRNHVHQLFDGSSHKKLSCDNVIFLTKTQLLGCASIVIDWSKTLSCVIWCNPHSVCIWKQIFSHICNEWWKILDFLLWIFHTIWCLTVHKMSLDTTEGFDFSWWFVPCPPDRQSLFSGFQWCVVPWWTATIFLVASTTMNDSFVRKHTSIHCSLQRSVFDVTEASKADPCALHFSCLWAHNFGFWLACLLHFDFEKPLKEPWKPLSLALIKISWLCSMDAIHAPKNLRQLSGSYGNSGLRNPANWFDNPSFKVTVKDLVGCGLCIPVDGQDTDSFAGSVLFPHISLDSTENCQPADDPPLICACNQQGGPNHAKLVCTDHSKVISDMEKMTGRSYFACMADPSDDTFNVPEFVKGVNLKPTSCKDTVLHRWAKGVPEVWLTMIFLGLRWSFQLIDSVTQQICGCACVSCCISKVNLLLSNKILSVPVQQVSNILKVNGAECAIDSLILCIANDEVHTACLRGFIDDATLLAHQNLAGVFTEGETKTPGQTSIFLAAADLVNRPTAKDGVQAPRMASPIFKNLEHLTKKWLFRKRAPLMPSFKTS